MLVEFKEARAYVAGDVRLVPGVSRISDQQWQTLQSYPKTKFYMDNNVLKQVSGDDAESRVTADLTFGSNATSPFAGSAAGTGAAPDDLSRVADTKEATRLVGATSDPNLLKAWRSNESRKDVLRAIDDRLKSL